MKKIVGVFLILSTTTAFMLPQKKAAVSQPTLKAAIERGKTVYLQRCMACHQMDGGGVPRLNPPLDGASKVKGADKVYLIRTVIKGMTERVEIDGEYYDNNMSANADLTDVQIADVLTYIRNSWSNKASVVSAAEVKAARAKIK
ncbi:c-type cytochrome [Sediminibacterium goheungense]|uniref:Mono/diheme cytochrome c family protein n=1 Tax=Sediminibacterium goheungense TaxID=1086393 RepID=A0A4R6J0W5_9BACT|nr:cytochrome c [Sediminibacterium goheungense]TDO28457.1 mono/diheme cytochrome c family protein [Sediminibacterium goheungense]